MDQTVREFSHAKWKAIRRRQRAMKTVYGRFWLHLMIAFLVTGACLVLSQLRISALGVAGWLPAVAKAFGIVAAFWGIILAIRILSICMRIYGPIKGLISLLLIVPLVGLYLLPMLIDSDLRRASVRSGDADAPDV